MSLGEAPKVRMIPISLVRSSRVTVIVLNIPIADTTSAIPPKTARVAWIPWKILDACSTVFESAVTRYPSSINSFSTTGKNSLVSTRT